MKPIKDKLTLNHWKNIAILIYRSADSFLDDKCMKMSASLAYYTTFSIGPLILIVIWCIGFFYGSQIDNSSAKQEVFEELTKIFGGDVALQIQGSVEKLTVVSDSNIGIIIGIITLMFTSTTIFVDIQDSINIIWGIKPKPKKGWLKLILNRLISFSMVLGLGFLLIATLIINSLIMIMMDLFNQYLPAFDINTLSWLNTIITFLVIVVLFGFIFKVLPDAKVRNKDVLGGAIFTAILFMLGRYGISLYLQFNATASAFGAAGSVIVLLLWVYFSAAILYFGAEFTKEHAKFFANGIQPSSYAVLVSHTETAIKSGKDASVETGEILLEKNVDEVDHTNH